jgi:hypothetical protein
MTVHHFRIYHNDSGEFRPYEPGQQLTATVDYRLDIADSIHADDLPEWAFHAFNADLDMLETERGQRGGETTFLTACVYRLLGFRSLSVGDVIEIVTGEHSRWFACDRAGWTAIETPPNITGRLLTARTVYDHLTAQRESR